MKVDELRVALSRYDAAELKEIAVMLYKVIPKKRKESDGLDDILLNFTTEKAKPTKKETLVDIGVLQEEIVTFIEYASESLYLAPNRIVNKDKRSKWRFEVRRFVKELIATSGENSETAAMLLADIYEMLCYACYYLIFSSDNPFSAIGYAQQDYLRLVLDRMFYSGFSQDTVKKAVFLTLDSNADKNTSHLTLLYELVSMLKTPDTKEMALAQCVAYAKEYSVYQAMKRVFGYPVKKDEYRESEHKNHAAELYLLLKFSLHEYDEGIAFFWENYKEHRKEITLFYLLAYFLSSKELSALWLREYEKAVAGGIEPRESLQREYEKRKNSENEDKESP